MITFPDYHSKILLVEFKIFLQDKGNPFIFVTLKSKIKREFSLFFTGIAQLVERPDLIGTKVDAAGPKRNKL